MIDWFAGAVASMSAAKDISQSLVTLRDAEMIRSKVFDLTNSLMDLQQQMMNAQVEQMRLIDELRNTKQALDEVKDTRQKKDRYERFKTPFGSFVYRLKADFSGSEIAHYLCSACFEQDKQVTLHQNDELLFCPVCRSIARLDHA